MTQDISRRDLIRTSILAASAIPFMRNVAPAAPAVPEVDGWKGLNIGVATYTLRDLPLAEAIKGVLRVGLTRVSVKNVTNHIDLSHSPEERRNRAKAMRDAGLVLMSVGNVAIKNDEADARRAFEFARDVGVPTMVCAPETGAVPLLDKLVKEFNIKLAIHNHGPEDKHFPSPYDVWKAVGKYDYRIGLCIDVGHTARAGVDPAQAIVKCRERLYDLHLKDISALGGKNLPVECGRGILNLPAIFGALLKINYRGLVGFEYEKDGPDPVPGLAECVGYSRGVLTGLK